MSGYFVDPSAEKKSPVRATRNRLGGSVIAPSFDMKARPDLSVAVDRGQGLMERAEQEWAVEAQSKHPKPLIEAFDEVLGARRHDSALLAGLAYHVLQFEQSRS